MKGLLLKMVKPLSFIPLSRLSSVTGKRVIMPFYHAIEDDPRPHLKHVYPVRSVAAFEKDLEMLLKHYSPVDAHLVYKRIHRGEPIPENTFLLSFDDGLSSVYSTVAPILLRKGIPAVFFINSRFIDNKEMFYRYRESLIVEHLQQQKHSMETLRKLGDIFSTSSDLDDIRNAVLNTGYDTEKHLNYAAKALELDFNTYLKNEKPYLNSEQVKALMADGFTIGAHSLNHPMYDKLSTEEQINQTLDCVTELKDNFGIDTRLFAFPFTDHGVGKAFFNAINAKQHEPFLTFGTAGVKNDAIPTNLQRIPIEIGSYTAEEIIRGEYLYYILKALVFKNKIKRA